MTTKSSHMRKSSLRVALCCLSALTAWRPTCAQTFTRRSEIPPLRLNYNDLASTLGRAQQLIATANKSYSPQYEHPEEWLDLSDSETSVQFGRENITSSVLESAPTVSTEAYYYYEYTGAPLSEVTISLNDSSREITVKGQSKTDVDAVSTLVSSDLERYTTTFAGVTFRVVGGFFLLVLLLLLISAGVVISIPRRFHIFLIILEVLLIVSINFLPWKDWLPGTTIYSGDASWIVRHQAGLAFLGTLVAIFTPLVALARWLYKSLRSAEAPSNQAGPPPRVR